MSIIEIPQRRLINSDTYQDSLAVAQRLLSQKETLPLNLRRQKIFDLLELVQYANPDDSIAVDQAVSLTTDLLLSDPLSDQQAGAVARCLRKIRSLDPWPFDLAAPQNPYYLTPAEMVEIMAGDWHQINSIFSRYPQRLVHWQESVRKTDNSINQRTVYRILELHPDDIESVTQFGMVPEGLHRFPNLSTLIISHQQQYLGLGNFPHHSGLEWLAEKLLISKSNLLIESWAALELGLPSPYKLGLATTTADNIAHRGSVYSGTYVFEIALPANRLVAHPKDGLPEDERTVMYHIEPQAIKAVYQIEPISKATTWEQIQYQKAKPLPKKLIGKILGR